VFVLKNHTLSVSGRELPEGSKPLDGQADALKKGIAVFVLFFPIASHWCNLTVGSDFDKWLWLLLLLVMSGFIYIYIYIFLL
jgi:hypothetical protein